MGLVGKEVVLVGVEDSGWWRSKGWKVEVVVKERIGGSVGGEEGRQWWGWRRRDGGVGSG